MKLYSINVGVMIIRFYIMMAIILFAGFTDNWWLSIFAFVIFFATLLGLKVDTGRKRM